jgi:hypothetical protein
MSKPKVASLPHSWSVSAWPEHVFPNRQSAATHLVRAHRKELVRLRALERIGRNLVIYGTGYAEFLANQSGRVEGYTIAPNRSARSQQRANVA